MNVYQVNKFLKLIVAFNIYIILIYIILNLPNNFFRDRDSYLIYATDSKIIYDLYDKSILLFNEPLFLFINQLLNNFFSSTFIVNFLLFSTFSGVYYLLYKYSKNVITFIGCLFLMLICYYSFHSQFVLLRQTLASLVLLMSLTYFKNIKLIFLVSLLCCFIHSSFFLILSLMVIYFIMNKLPIELKSLIIIIISSVVGILVTSVGVKLGFRQATEDHVTSTVNVGGGAFLCFSIILFYLLKFYKKDSHINNIYHFSIIGLSCFIGLYFVSPIAGRLMNTFILGIFLLLSAKSNLLNLTLIFILTLFFSYIAFRGDIAGMSLNVTYEQLFNYIFRLLL